MISAVAHSTDFSPEGQTDFVHALRLALAHRSRLDLLHVRSNRDQDHFGNFTQVRKVLQCWGVLTLGASPEDVAPATGVSVLKVKILDADPVDGLSRILLVTALTFSSRRAIDAMAATAGCPVGSLLRLPAKRTPLRSFSDQPRRRSSMPRPGH